MKKSLLFTLLTFTCLFTLAQVTKDTRSTDSLLHKTDTTVHALTQVVVSSHKKYMEMKADKMVLNVENNAMAAGSSAFEVVRNAPGVAVDKDDHLLLRGKSGLQILIDGRPTYLSADDLTNLLKNMQASDIATVEIITNPSARYDASGNAGIINIKLKKNSLYGLNGSYNISLGKGEYYKMSGGLNLNYRSPKVNVFGGITPGRYDGFNKRIYNSEIATGTNKQYQERNNLWRPLTWGSNTKFGVDYTLDSKTVIGIVVLGSYFKEPAKSYNQLNFYDYTHQLTSAISTFTNTRSQSNNTSVNLNFKKQLDSTGSEWTIDADYVLYKKSIEEAIQNDFTDAFQQKQREALLFKNSNPVTVDVTSIKTDLTKEFAGKWKLEAGAKSSWVNTDSDVRFDSSLNNSWITDHTRTNHFKYTEGIAAAYASGSKEWKLWTVQLGLRGEYTHSNGHSVTNNTSFKRDYVSAFPTLFVQRKQGEFHVFGFSYGRRIGRPSYKDLNDYTYAADNYTFFRGNPYLKPQFTHAMELKYAYRQVLFASLAYSVTNDVVGTAITQDTITSVVYNISENMNQTKYVNFSLSSPYSPVSWWDMSNSMDISYNKVNAPAEQSSYRKSAVSYSIQSNHSFTLPAGFRLQLTADYSSPGVSGMFLYKSSFFTSVAVQKSLMNKKASLRLSMSDLFNTSRFRADIKNETLNIFWQNRWESRKVYLTFSMKFGGTKIKAARTRRSAADAEADRINY